MAKAKAKTFTTVGSSILVYKVTSRLRGPDLQVCKMCICLGENWALVVFMEWSNCVNVLSH